MKKNWKLIKSEKGDAIILISVVVTGLVLLVTAVMVQALRDSARVEGIEKKSLDSVYKAEEGVEYTLFTVKNKGLTSYKNREIPDKFKLKIFKGSPSQTCPPGLPPGQDGDCLWPTSVISNSDKLNYLVTNLQPDQFVVTSQNMDNSNDNNNETVKRTSFSNIPSSFYNQLTIWDKFTGCNTLSNNGSSCTESTDDDLVNNKQYKLFITGSNIPSAWDPDLAKYRASFQCQNSESCTIKDFKMEPVDSTKISCKYAFTSSSRADQDSGNVVVYDWNSYKNVSQLLQSTDPDHIIHTIGIYFKLDKGTLAEMQWNEQTPPSNDKVVMCEADAGESMSSDKWNFVPNKWGGLLRIEAKQK